MKKFLLCVVAAAFLFGCATGEPEYLAQMDQLQAALAEYQGKCADVVFADASDKMGEMNRFRANDQIEEADAAYLEAQQLFDAGVVTYNDIQSAADRSDSELADQRSRLSNIESDAMMYAPQEYADAKARINSQHADAASKIAVCDGEGAVMNLDEAEREIRYLEDLVAVRMNAAMATPPPAPIIEVPEMETYTVAKGDSLWKIAANKYSNPYFWPLIYWTNKSSIKDPDLIYPDQQLSIDANATDEQKSEADKMAKTRGAWSLYDNK